MLQVVLSPGQNEALSFVWKGSCFTLFLTFLFRWFGKCWHVHNLLKYEFDVEFDVSKLHGVTVY